MSAGSDGGDPRRNYIRRHRIHCMLDDVIQRTLEEMPADPVAYMADQLAREGGRTLPEIVQQLYPTPPLAASSSFTHGTTNPRVTKMLSQANESFKSAVKTESGTQMSQSSSIAANGDVLDPEEIGNFDWMVAEGESGSGNDVEDDEYADAEDDAAYDPIQEVEFWEAEAREELVWELLADLFVVLFHSLDLQEGTARNAVSESWELVKTPTLHKDDDVPDIDIDDVCATALHLYVGRPVVTITLRILAPYLSRQLVADVPRSTAVRALEAVFKANGWEAQLLMLPLSDAMYLVDNIIFSPIASSSVSLGEAIVSKAIFDRCAGMAVSAMQSTLMGTHNFSEALGLAQVAGTTISAILTEYASSTLASLNDFPLHHLMSRVTSSCPSFRFSELSSLQVSPALKHHIEEFNAVRRKNVEHARDYIKRKLSMPEVNLVYKAILKRWTHLRRPHRLVPLSRFFAILAEAIGTDDLFNSSYSVGRGLRLTAEGCFFEREISQMLFFWVVFKQTKGPTDIVSHLMCEISNLGDYIASLANMEYREVEILCFVESCLFAMARNPGSLSDAASSCHNCPFLRDIFAGTYATLACGAIIVAVCDVYLAAPASGSSVIPLSTTAEAYITKAKPLLTRFLASLVASIADNESTTRSRAHSIVNPSMVQHSSSSFRTNEEQLSVITPLALWTEELCAGDILESYLSFVLDDEGCSTTARRSKSIAEGQDHTAWMMMYTVRRFAELQYSPRPHSTSYVELRRMMITLQFTTTVSDAALYVVMTEAGDDGRLADILDVITTVGGEGLLEEISARLAELCDKINKLDNMAPGRGPSLRQIIELVPTVVSHINEQPSEPQSPLSVEETATRIGDTNRSITGAQMVTNQDIAHVQDVMEALCEIDCPLFGNVAAILQPVSPRLAASLSFNCSIYLTPVFEPRTLRSLGSKNLCPEIGRCATACVWSGVLAEDFSLFLTSVFEDITDTATANDIDIDPSCWIPVLSAIRTQMVQAVSSTKMLRFPFTDRMTGFYNDFLSQYQTSCAPPRYEEMVSVLNVLNDLDVEGKQAPTSAISDLAQCGFFPPLYHHFSRAGLLSDVESGSLSPYTPFFAALLRLLTNAVSVPLSHADAVALSDVPEPELVLPTAYDLLYKADVSLYSLFHDHSDTLERLLSDLFDYDVVTDITNRMPAALEEFATHFKACGGACDFDGTVLFNCLLRSYMAANLSPTLRCSIGRILAAASHFFVAALSRPPSEFHISAVAATWSELASSTRPQGLFTTVFRNADLNDPSEIVLTELVTITTSIFDLERMQVKPTNCRALVTALMLGGFRLKELGLFVSLLLNGVERQARASSLEWSQNHRTAWTEVLYFICATGSKGMSIVSRDVVSVACGTWQQLSDKRLRFIEEALSLTCDNCPSYAKVVSTVPHCGERIHSLFGMVLGMMTSSTANFQQALKAVAARQVMLGVTRQHHTVLLQSIITVITRELGPAATASVNSALVSLFCFVSNKMLSIVEIDSVTANIIKAKFAASSLEHLSEASSRMLFEKMMVSVYGQICGDFSAGYKPALSQFFAGWRAMADNCVDLHRLSGMLKLTTVNHMRRGLTQTSMKGFMSGAKVALEFILEDMSTIEVAAFNRFQNVLAMLLLPVVNAPMTDADIDTVEDHAAVVSNSMGAVVDELVKRSKADHVLNPFRALYNEKADVATSEMTQLLEDFLRTVCSLRTPRPFSDSIRQLKLSLDFSCPQYARFFSDVCLVTEEVLGAEYNGVVMARFAAMLHDQLSSIRGQQMNIDELQKLKEEFEASLQRVRPATFAATMKRWVVWHYPTRYTYLMMDEDISELCRHLTTHFFTQCRTRLMIEDDSRSSTSRSTRRSNSSSGVLMFDGSLQTELIRRGLEHADVLIFQRSVVAALGLEMRSTVPLLWKRLVVSVFEPMFDTDSFAMYAATLDVGSQAFHVISTRARAENFKRICAVHAPAVYNIFEEEGGFESTMKLLLQRDEFLECCESLAVRACYSLLLPSDVMSFATLFVDYYLEGFSEKERADLNEVFFKAFRGITMEMTAIQGAWVKQTGGAQKLISMLNVVADNYSLFLTNMQKVAGAKKGHILAEFCSRILTKFHSVVDCLEKISENDPTLYLCGLSWTDVRLLIQGTLATARALHGEADFAFLEPHLLRVLLDLRLLYGSATMELTKDVAENLRIFWDGLPEDITEEFDSSPLGVYCRAMFAAATSLIKRGAHNLLTDETTRVFLLMARGAVHEQPQLFRFPPLGEFTRSFLRTLEYHNPADFCLEGTERAVCTLLRGIGQAVAQTTLQQNGPCREVAIAFFRRKHELDALLAFIELLSEDQRMMAQLEKAVGADESLRAISTPNWVGIAVGCLLKAIRVLDSDDKHDQVVSTIDSLEWWAFFDGDLPARFFITMIEIARTLKHAALRSLEALCCDVLTLFTVDHTEDSTRIASSHTVNRTPIAAVVHKNLISEELMSCWKTVKDDVMGTLRADITKKPLPHMLGMLVNATVGPYEATDITHIAKGFGATCHVFLRSGVGVDELKASATRVLESVQEGCVAHNIEFDARAWVRVVSSLLHSLLDVLAEQATGDFVPSASSGMPNASLHIAQDLWHRVEMTDLRRFGREHFDKVCASSPGKANRAKEFASVLDFYCAILQRATFPTCCADLPLASRQLSMINTVVVDAGGKAFASTFRDSIPQDFTATASTAWEQFCYYVTALVETRTPVTGSTPTQPPPVPVEPGL